jgi:5-methyltetrahydropteroyltriglutamate--homocysteine methyltransferase
MQDNDAITTTVVGSYTVPDWYPALQSAVRAGELAPEAFADAKAVAARAAVKDQETARIDVVSDGELFRRDDNRFGPPNAMITHFAAKIPGFARELRDKSGITPVAPDAVLPAPVVVDELEPAPLGLTDELAFLRATTERPVKIAMTGPHMFACVAWDEHYGSREALAFAMADVVNAELRRLDDAGCDAIQLDEPVLWFLAGDREWGVEAINRCFAGVTNGLRVLHLCQGNYNPDPGAHVGIRIFPAEFDAVRPLLEGAAVDVVHLAFASLGVEDLAPLRDFPRDKALAVGVVDVQSHRVETPDEVAATLERVVSALDGSPVVAAPDCGLNHLPRDVAFAKLQTLARGVALVSGALVREAAGAPA